MLILVYDSKHNTSAVISRFVKELYDLQLILGYVLRKSNSYIAVRKDEIAGAFYVNEKIHESMGV